MTNTEFRDIVFSFENTVETPHFDRLAFKVTGKRIFASLHEASQSANIKLPLIEQSVFCDYGKAVYPVDNKWGKQGWTTFELRDLPKALVADALNVAFFNALKPKS